MFCQGRAGVVCKAAMEEMEEKYLRLWKEIRSLGGAIVAFSGGVDSTFLLHTAFCALGVNCVAVTVCSPLTREDAMAEALAYTRSRGIRHEMLDWDVFACESVTSNGPERCYHCKKEIFTLILSLAHRWGIQHILEGSNRDDEDDFRPGLKALKELGILSPLALCGLGKEEIRLLSRRLNIPGWERAADACLATRFPFGRPLTREGLRQVEKAEAYLRSLGYPAVRVRHHGEVARIELPPPDIKRFAETVELEKVSDTFRAYGFTFTALDLKGYRQGNMNTLVSKKE
ncbi:MAG TPA: ATP-dependent sacrificial sulfur transferase LarE [Syntrophales bacterium]|nr:ATP-dependent sacrificial sulfur transferase LarE [Syntrophales bacterium]HOL59317.1 ATP-dependent sacrificial sulfur transferase LarE [Syntrophales bacterium]HPO35490.1 ATP-dependent sacrificial sulfur transferase LarE [Syntrophales bacterium]